MIVARRFRALVSLAFAGLVLAACGPSGDVAATVGGNDISGTRVEARAHLFQFLNSFSGTGQCGVKEPGSTETDEAACNRLALGNLIQTAIAQTYASDHGIEPDGKEADDAITSLDDSAGADQVDQALTQYGVTREQLRAFALDSIVIREVSRSVVADQVGADRLQREYEQRIDDFTTLQVRHILVQTKAEADEVYRQVTAPGATTDTFAELARTMSVDTGSGQQGGSLGPVAASAVGSTYVKPFADAVLALEPGEISSPVQTEFGWHVILMEDSQVSPFSQARSQLLDELAGDLFAGWMRAQIQTLDVQVNPSYGRLNPQTLTVDRIASTDPGASASPAQPTVVPASP